MSDCYDKTNWCMLVKVLRQDALPTIFHRGKLELFGQEVACYNPHIKDDCPYRHQLTVIFPIWKPENTNNPEIVCEINPEYIELVAVFNVALPKAKMIIDEQGLEKLLTHAKSTWHQPQQIALAKTA